MEQLCLSRYHICDSVNEYAEIQVYINKDLCVDCKFYNVLYIFSVHFLGLNFTVCSLEVTYQ